MKGYEDGVEIGGVSEFHLVDGRMSRETLDERWANNRHEHSDNQYAYWLMIQRRELHILANRSTQSSNHVIVVSGKIEQLQWHSMISLAYNS